MAENDPGDALFSKLGTEPNQPVPIEPAGDGSRPEMELAQPPQAPPVPTVNAKGDFGREIAARMKDKGYHPVIIVGTTSSGKTSLLTSLLGYILTAAKDSELELRIGEPLVPTNVPYGQSVFDEATTFLDVVVYEFMKRRAAAATRFNYPFYIPVRLTRNGEKEPRRFAFLEGQGEWYDPTRVEDKDGSQRLAGYQKLREEVVNVLRHFPNPISFIYVAPYTTEVAYKNVLPGRDASRREENANLSLKGMLDAYPDVRTTTAFDKHLFLLSKWDIHTGGVQDESFVRTNAETISELLQQRFRESWTRFLNMQDKGSDEARAFMQYSAGPISDADVIDVRDVDLPNLHRYPRTVLNWLWGNATGGEVLYSDVMPQPPRELTALERVASWVGSG